MLSVKRMMLKDFRRSLVIQPLSLLVPVKRAVVRHQKHSESDAQRALVLPQELGTLEFSEEFIILKGENPVKAKKPFTTLIRILWTGLCW
jgi:hypothetical protein